MRISCSNSELLNGVQIVYKAVPSKTTMTILEFILVEAMDDRIKLTANDTELGIETYIEGNIEEEGSICLDARMLQDMVRKLPDSEVIIFTDNDLVATILCEKSKKPFLTSQIYYSQSHEKQIRILLGRRKALQINSKELLPVGVVMVILQTVGDTLRV